MIRFPAGAVRFPWRLLLALVAGLTVLSGCAAIPSSSGPTVVKEIDEQGRVRPIAPPPEPGIDKFSLVRDFIRYSADPSDNHAAARQYLAAAPHRNWQTTAGPLLVLADNFSTTPLIGDDDPNRASLELRGTRLGKLAVDKSFHPDFGTYDLRINVVRENGEWRIVDPPPDLVVTNSGFTQFYEGVPLYFLSPDHSRVVPDLRYIVTEPRASQPGQVIDLLLKGPSDTLGAAVTSALPDGALTRTNVATAAEGQLVVDLTHVGSPNSSDRQLIAAQVVLSLSSVTVARTRLLADGVVLSPNHPDWTLDDVRGMQPDDVRQDLPGFVASNGVLRSMDTGTEVKGASGPGSPAVVSGAQSLDGSRLATVVRSGNQQVLRIGQPGSMTRDAGVAGGQLTRPTWMPNAHEVWTVVNSNSVHRLVDSGNGVWDERPVSISQLAGYGPITDLRLSRDGARAAVVAGNRLYVAALVTGPDGTVNLVQPQQLLAETLSDVVAVDWDRQDSLTVATLSTSNPVYRVSVDGLTYSSFSSANLTQPITAITAAPNKPVVVADNTGLWVANDAKEIWHLHPRGQGIDIGKPFYPG